MHSRGITFATLIGAALLAGCATKSEPTRDEIIAQSSALSRLDLNSAWRAGADSGSVADNWLATFDDAELNALIIEAMANNPDLQVTATRVEIASQFVVAAKAALGPAVNLFGSGGAKMGGGDALQILSLGVTWELDLWGRLRYGRSAAQADYASVQADYEFARQSLAATIAKSWFTASETWLQIQIAEQMVASAQELLTLAESRHRIGPDNEQDVALARANLGTFRDAEQQVRFAHSQALRALELLVGRYPAAELAARQELDELPASPSAGLPLEMLERRPDMIAAERRVAAAFNRVGEAKAARLPRITLNANVAALRSEILQLEDDFSNPTGGLGAVLLAPIYDGGTLKAQAEIRTLEQKQAVAQFAQMTLRALGDVESAIAAAQTLEERQIMLQQVVADHERALDLARTSYRIGSGDFRAVQQQLVNVQSAELSLLRVRSEQLAQRVNLHLALGGSFETPPAPPSTSTPPSTKPDAQDPS